MALPWTPKPQNQRFSHCEVESQIRRHDTQHMTTSKSESSRCDIESYKSCSDGDGLTEASLASIRNKLFGTALRLPESNTYL